MNMQGYAYMWHKARLAAGLPDSEDRPIRFASRKIERRAKPERTAMPMVASAEPPRPRKHRTQRVARTDAASGPSLFSPLSFLFRRN
jgi:hypothetical protein